MQLAQIAQLTGFSESGLPPPLKNRLAVGLAVGVGIVAVRSGLECGIESGAPTFLCVCDALCAWRIPTLRYKATTFDGATIRGGSLEENRGLLNQVGASRPQPLVKVYVGVLALKEHGCPGGDDIGFAGGALTLTRTNDSPYGLPCAS